jgi:hypothetical protein
MSIKLDPLVIEKERKVLELRLMGVTFDVIAQQVGYASPGSAHNAYKRALLRTLREPAQELRELEVARLDKLLSSIWTEALRGEIPAIQTSIKIMERRAKLLGLDVPVKIQAEVTTYDGGSDIDREVQRLANLLAQGESGGRSILVGEEGSED